MVNILKIYIQDVGHELLQSISAERFAPFRQIFTEFHSPDVERYSPIDTAFPVDSECGFGYKRHPYKDHSYFSPAISRTPIRL